MPLERHESLMIFSAKIFKCWRHNVVFSNVEAHTLDRTVVEFSSPELLRAAGAAKAYYHNLGKDPTAWHIARSATGPSRSNRMYWRIHIAACLAHCPATKQQVEIPADFKWQWRPSSSGSPVDSASAGGGGMTPEHHASTDDDGEVRKKTRTSRSHHVVAPTLIHDEDYAGPNGHSPNHHRTIRCTLLAAATE
ncbi:hypothetical protein HU200_028793 [Digitaria exilis]|uniref:Uncharacterized protein n=1 Tax=Digitaria exilis TaxID=1010633 RepID=A0A835EQ57_9POAL|nr:hypothetical protein HU200_028793 [Digitaria exilis]